MNRLKSILHAFRLDPGNVLLNNLYIRSSFQRHKYEHNIRMVVLFALVLAVVEPLSLLLFHGSRILEALVDTGALYRRNLLLLQLYLALLALCFLVFYSFMNRFFKTVDLKIKHHLSMVFMLFGYLGLSGISLNAQLYHGSIVIGAIALFAAGITFYLSIYFQVLIYAVFSLFIIFMTGYIQEDALLARISQINYAILTGVAWLVAVYFQNYRLRNYLNYFCLKEKSVEEEKDLELAHHIQKGLLPSENPRLKNFTINFVHESLEHVGGDLVDFVRFKESHLHGIFLCDVAGHGVSAAMVTSMIKTIIQSMDDRKLSPAAFLAELNRKTMLLTESFIYTAFYGVLNDETRSMIFARAGHCYPLHFTGDRAVEVKSRGHLLGFRDEIAIEEKTISFETGDSLLLYTDGFSEEENPDGQLFQFHFEELLRTGEVRDNNSLDSQRLFKLLCRFKGGAPFKDDVCIVTINVR